MREGESQRDREGQADALFWPHRSKTPCYELLMERAMWQGPESDL